MPALKLCGRRWRSASDDYVYVGLLNVFANAAWFACLLYLCVSFRPNDCSQQSLLLAYIVFHLFTTVFMLAMDVLLVHHSSRGSIPDVGRREFVETLLLVQLLLLMLEGFVISLGSITLFAIPPCDFSDTNRQVLFAVIISSYIVFGFRLLSWWWDYDPLGSTEDDSLPRRVANRWKRRLRRCCCFATTTDEQWEELADTFYVLFEGTDVVASDIAAGLILLHGRQRAAVAKARRIKGPEYFSATDQIRPLSGTADAEVLKTLGYYVPYALGAYGWMPLVQSKPCTGTCALLQSCSPGVCCFPRHENTGDNCCHCSLMAMRAQLAGVNCTVRFSSFRSSVGHTAYFIAVDHEKKAIVLGCRGTLSLADSVTDGLAAPKPVTLPTIGNARVHSGAYAAAVSVMAEIRAQQVLERALHDFPGHRLVICGHSLGAAVAVLLGCMLRPDHPGLHVYAYGSPALLDAASAEACSPFVTMLTVGHDLVPRLSLHRLLRLRSDLLAAIYHAAMPKWRILASTVFKRFATVWWQDPDHALSQPGSQTDSRHDPAKVEPLLPPGRIIHLIKSQATTKMCKKSREYRPYWAARTNFLTLIISGRMAWDHFPGYTADSLRDVLRQDSIELDSELTPNPVSEAPNVRTFVEIDLDSHSVQEFSTI